MKVVYIILTRQLTDRLTKHPHTISMIVFGRMFLPVPSLSLELPFTFYIAFIFINLFDSSTGANS